ncbi:hypothetical protein ACLUXW_00090 [Limosilactobacillus reuteri subsp. suis]|uniref:hypothetical protein n=1 Tax=Limosilactobacillus reuteri TaxID=1598 RepID=UPI003993C1C7
MDTKFIDKKIEEVERVVYLHGGDAVILCKSVLGWLKEIREKVLSNQKYTVQVLPGEFGYLNFIRGEGFSVNSSEATDVCQTYFTQAEINEFKKKHDLAIDWDKAIIESVKAEL